MGTFEKVHKETLTKKIACETGAGCVGWDLECYSGIFGRCGPMDPFIIWKQHVKESDYDESLDLFMDLFGCDTFDNPFGGGAEVSFVLNCFF